MAFRLVALDLDGTTVVAGQPPSQRLLRALAAAQDRGVVVALATGRNFLSTESYAVALGLTGPLICMQGALVREQNNSRATLLSCPLAVEPLGEVVHYADSHTLELTLYTESEIFAAHRRHDRDFYVKWFGQPARDVPGLWELAQRLEAQSVPLLKGLIAGEPADIGRLRTTMQTLVGDRLEVMRSHALFLEMVGPGVSKARALAVVAKRCGAMQSETIAVGDSGNDVSMIEWAGLGVAVANAASDALAAADWIAPAVSADGVAEVIERFVLDSEIPPRRFDGSPDTPGASTEADG